jgi:hypothetical protein
MSNNDVKLKDLLRKSDSLELQDFEVRESSMKNVSKQVVEFVTAKTELEAKENKEFLFTPKMLHEIFEVNNSKYFADFLWTHSDNPKNIVANPKNKIYFTSPRRSVYKLKVTEEKSS